MATPLTVYQSSVQTWETDQMGHMNVQFYMEKATAGLATFAHHLDLGPRRLREQGLRVRPQDYHVRFLREQRPGAPLLVSASVVGIGTRSIRVYQEMLNPASGEVAATFTCDLVLEDASSGEVQPIPDAAAKAAAQLERNLPDYAKPRGLSTAPPDAAPTVARAERLGMLTTYTSVVQPGMCDGDGIVTPRACMGIVSDSIPNLLVQIYGMDRSKSETGGAALEYRFVYHERARAGDLLSLRSCITGIADKTYTFCHWLFNPESGTAVATAEAVAVMFDLKARKAITIPDDVRARLAAHLVPEARV